MCIKHYLRRDKFCPKGSSLRLQNTNGVSDMYGANLKSVVAEYAEAVVDLSETIQPREDITPKFNLFLF